MRNAFPVVILWRRFDMSVGHQRETLFAKEVDETFFGWGELAQFDTGFL